MKITKTLIKEIEKINERIRNADVQIDVNNENHLSLYGLYKEKIINERELIRRLEN